VQSVTATTLVLSSAYAVAEGDLLVNLAADTGTAAPNYDGAGITIYTDMDYQNAATNNTVLTDSYGRYRYFYAGIPRWELIRSGNTLIALYLDTANSSIVATNEYDFRYAHLFATSGGGTEDSPWATTDSNPVQAALNDLPTTGGTVYMVPGYYALGTGSNAVTIPILTSSTDRRSYRFEGAGRDLVFLLYSGSGNAIRYPQVNTGTAGSSWQSNQLVFRGFSLHQTGTARTGTGISCNYISESLFEDMNIGNVRTDRSLGENDYGFEYGVHFSGGFGDEVSDFNRFHRIHALGNKWAIYIQNQGDNTVISECSFEPRQDSNDEQNGVFIGNSSGLTIKSNHFNFFGKNRSATNYTQAFGLSLGVDISGAVIEGNYFEGNSRGIRLADDPSGNAGHKDGIVIQGNLFAMQDVYGDSGGNVAYGIEAGQNSATWFIRGLVIQGNQFQSIGDYSRGVRICSDVKSFVLQGNRYQITAGKTDAYTNVILSPASGGPGAEGMVFERAFESNSTTAEQPSLYIQQVATDSTAITLNNRSGASGKSPRIKFMAGSAATQEFMSMDVNESGAFRWLDAAGAAVATVSQVGAIAASSSITSGGHIRGLKATEALTTSAAIATVNRTLIDITNTSGSNTPTLVAPSSVDGQILILRCAALTAGTITLADSGNCALSAAWVPDAGDTLTLIASGAIWYEIARSAN